MKIEKTEWNGKLKEMGVVEAIYQHPEATEIERLMGNWANVPLLSAVGDEEAARKLAEITLVHTNLFGILTLPSYAAHMFWAHRKFPPTNDEQGRLMKSNLEVVAGELCTNNIFQRDGESHSHYFDMQEAYFALRGDPCPTGTLTWSDSMFDYEKYLRRTTEDPLATFMISLVSEETIGESYKTILANLSPDQKYNAWRTFMKRHIELDEAEHGPITTEWLNYYIESARPSSNDVASALEKTKGFIETKELVVVK